MKYSNRLKKKVIYSIYVKSGVRLKKELKEAYFRISLLYVIVSNSSFGGAFAISSFLTFCRWMEFWLL